MYAVHKICAEFPEKFVRQKVSAQKQQMRDADEKVMVRKQDLCYDKTDFKLQTIKQICIYFYRKQECKGEQICVEL